MAPFCNLSKLTLLLIIFTLIFSCSEDSDLLEEYALYDDTIVDPILIRDDIFTTDGGSIILDVLSNDSFPKNTKVTITELSNPYLWYC